MDLQQIWNDAIDRVAATISDEQKKAILFGIIKLQVSIQIINNVVIFTCNNELTFSLLSTQYVIPILNEIKLLTGQNLSMQLQMSAVNQAPPTVNQAPVNQNSVNNDSYQAVTQASMAPSSSLHKIDMPKFMRQDRINPEKTFESYVCDKENFLIYTIAQKIADNPVSDAFNPFYIYGGSGLGKTHLLFAIANKLRVTHPELSVVYTRAEEFIHNYVESISRKNFDPQQVHFQELFTQYDVFIMDDIQNLIKADKARDTFFDIIADFLDKPGRQLILVSDVPPGNLKNFSPRLVSRFGSGVCREIYPPSSETRAAITLNKCRELNITLPESVVDYIAENIRSSVREIEGAIKTLASHLQVYGEITYDQAVNNLKNLVNVKSQITTLEAIKERVAKEFDLPKVEVLDSAARKKPIPTARAMAMCLASELIPALSLNDIGRSFNKDHSSVHEAIKKLRAKLLDENEKELAAIYQNLTTSLKKD